jgi:glycosyltransferase involved in cell wall biosynthesis
MKDTEMGDNRIIPPPGSGSFQGRLAVQQRVLPNYRAGFFDLLAAACQGGLSVFAGQPRPSEAIQSAQGLQVAQWVQAKNLHLFGGRYYLCWQSNLQTWLQVQDPAALIVEANLRNLSTLPGVTWMHLRRRPVIGWGLGIPGLNPPDSGWVNTRLTGLRRGFLRQMDAIITYSQAGAQQYRTAGFPADLVFVAPNAVAPRPTTPPPLRPETFAGSPTILFVGRLQPRKRIDNLLHACAALPQSSQPRLWIIGDGPARAELEALARQVYPQAQFFGARYGDELHSYFTQADLFVLPGTGGLAVQQALSYALPVIAAEADGTQQDLVRPENGWQIPSNDVPALTGALTQALADPLRLRQMGAASYRIVNQEINLENMVQVFLKALAAVTS